jgi:hypothetical protein
MPVAGSAMLDTEGVAWASAAVLATATDAVDAATGTAALDASAASDTAPIPLFKASRRVVARSLVDFAFMTLSFLQFERTLVQKSVLDHFTFTTSSGFQVWSKNSTPVP